MTLVPVAGTAHDPTHDHPCLVRFDRAAGHLAGGPDHRPMAAGRPVPAGLSPLIRARCSPSSPGASSPSTRRPAQLIVDPLAGIGTTIVEAALLDRRAVGIELEARWAALAEENLDHMLDPDRQGPGRGAPRRRPSTPRAARRPGWHRRPHRHLTAVCVRRRGHRQAGLAGRRPAVPARQPQLLDRPGQPRPRPRHRLRRSHGRDLHRLPRSASARRPAGGGHQEHPPQGPHPRPRRPYRRPGHRRPGSPTSATSSPCTPPSATASSPAAPPTGRPPSSATPESAASPPISWPTRT